MAQPDHDTAAETSTNRASVRADVRRILAELDTEWTPERWAQARREQTEALMATA